jgi:hypothetical protein
MTLTPLAADAQVATPEAPISIGEPRVIGIQTLANDLTIDDTLVGGLSGIDYDPASGQWIAISDDRSENAPSRYYNLDLDYTAETFNPVTVQDAVILTQPNGDPYPDAASGGTVPDLESVRIDPLSGLIWYANEGVTTRGIDPILAASTSSGEFVAQPQLPALFEVDPAMITGPLEGYGMEGMSFSSDAMTVWVALEGPLYQDGSPPTVDRGATTRITHLDRSGALIG